MHSPCGVWPGLALNQGLEDELLAVLRANDQLVKDLERLDTIGSMLQYQVVVAEDTIKETQENLDNFRHLVRPACLSGAARPPARGRPSNRRSKAEVAPAGRCAACQLRVTESQMQRSASYTVWTLLDSLAKGMSAPALAMRTRARALTPPVRPRFASVLPRSSGRSARGDRPLGALGPVGSRHAGVGLDVATLARPSFKDGTQHVYSIGHLLMLYFL